MMQSCQGSKHCPVLKEYAVKLRNAEASRLFIVHNISHDPGTMVYAASCPRCGRNYRKLLWRKRSEGKLFDKLQRHFRQCEDCGQWVCADCHLVWNDQDNTEVCVKCAQTRGVNGYTAEQYKAYRKEHPQTPAEIEAEQQKFIGWAVRRQEQIDAFLAEFDANEPIWGGELPDEEH